MVMKASTRTASRWPEMRVDAIGDHIHRCVPGGRSLVIIWGMPGVTDTSQFSGMSRVSVLAIQYSSLLVIFKLPQFRAFADSTVQPAEFRSTNPLMHLSLHDPI